MKYKAKCTNVTILVLNIYGSRSTKFIYEGDLTFVEVQTEREAKLIEQLNSLRDTEIEIYNLIVKVHKNNK